jgi:hypothetical protein
MIAQTKDNALVMSWTASGVLAVALYAAEQKQKSAQTSAQTTQPNAKIHTTT